MNIIDQIKKLAGGAADLALQKFETKRIGAEAERRGLFEAHLRSVPSGTLTDMKRERTELFVNVSDEELRTEFAKRKLYDNGSFDAGWAARTDQLSAVKAALAAVANQLARL